MPPQATDPIWQDVKLPKFAPLAREGRFDVAVIGGGITGLTAAYFLKQAGKKVCLLERDELANGYTACTTAHLTCVTDTRLSRLVETFGREQAALAWYAGAAAIDVIEQIAAENEINCSLLRVPGFLHAALDGEHDESRELEDEANLARELGFDAAFVDEVPVVRRSFESRGSGCQTRRSFIREPTWLAWRVSSRATAAGSTGTRM
jgi:glycine/D-amino acid oxidase-like deaminating enzyme